MSSSENCPPHLHIPLLRGCVERMSLHCYGCRVVQRLIEKCAGTSLAYTLNQEVICALPVLCQDQYGNYVVQHVMQVRGGIFEAFCLFSTVSPQTELR